MKKILLLIVCLVPAAALFAQQMEITEPSEVRYNQYGIKVQREPVHAENRSGMLVFESPSQDYRFWFDTRVQVDGAMFFGLNKDYDPIGNNVSIRRARLALKAQVTPNWYGEIDSDFSNGVYELKDAYLRYSSCWGLNVSAGNFKEDFSMEQTTSSRYLPFMERPMVVQTFSPSRHLGIDVQWHHRWFNISGGVFFQAVAGLEEITNVEANNKDEGRNQGMDFTGKFTLHPLYRFKDVGLHIAAGGSYRQPKTDMAIMEYGMARYNTRNATSINRRKYVDSDLIPGVDHEFLYNGEMAAFWKGFRIQGEYISNNIFIKNNAPATVNKSVKRFSGWYAHVGFVLFGGQQRFDYMDGEFTQPSRGRKWGDIELLARYDYINMNNANILGGAAENYTLGVNYYVNSNVKFVLNYQYTNNDRYANGRGKLKVGHDANGVATSNYRDVVEKGGKAGVDYQMLSMRFEIDF